MKEVIIRANDAGQRLDKFLQKSFPELKKSMMYKAIRNKKIKVNRKRASFDQKLNEGDILLLFLPMDMLSEKETGISSQSSKEAADVVYENDDLLIVWKPSGLLSQKDSVKDQDTVNGRIVNYLVSTGAYNPETEHSFVPVAAHRLDRNTEGLMAAGKTAAMQRELSRAIADHSMKKYYLAWVMGKVDHEGLVSLYMKKDDTMARVLDHPEEGYVKAVMNIRPVFTRDNQTLIEVELLSGRFHQIRACMAFLGHPLIGDHKYGYQGKIKTQQLAAWKLDFQQTSIKNAPSQVIRLPEFIRKEKAEDQKTILKKLGTE